MTSAEYCRMGEIEDVGTVGREYMGRLLRMGAILCQCLCVDLLEVGEPLGLEWASEHFVENRCRGSRGRDGKPDLVGRGSGEESHRQNL